MKKLLVLFCLSTLFISASQAQVYINEVLANPSGGDSTASAGFEYFELRGTPNMSLAGYYLLGLEGQGTTGGRGDINQFFNLGAFSIGANGFLFGQQFGSPYTSIAAGASVISNSVSQGWGQGNTAVGTTAGHSSDGTQLDMENSATTILLVNIGGGPAPTLTTDLDTGVEDGLLDLPAGWSVIDSVGIMDGVSGAATDFSYGAITLRLGTLGTSANGNIVTVPSGTGTGFYVGRKGSSAGSTPSDWFGSVISGSAGNFTFSSASDSFYNGMTVAGMTFGGPNAVPEPSTWALLGLGVAGISFCSIRRSLKR